MKTDIEDIIAAAKANGTPVKLKVVPLVPKLVPKKAHIADPAQMRSAIEERFGQGGPARQLNDDISKFVVQGLSLTGEFYRDSEGRHLYINKADPALYDIGTERFDYHLSGRTFLRTVEPAFSFAKATLNMICSQLKPVTLSSFGHRDPETGRMTISFADVATYTYAGDGTLWQAGLNGDNGLLFHDDEPAEPFAPNFKSEGKLEQYLRSFSLDGGLVLSEKDQQTLILVWMVALFFGLPNSMLLAMLGDAGSTKSSAARFIGRTLLGPRFETMDVSTDKDSVKNMRVAVCNNLLLCLDNVDTAVEGLENFLATNATGTEYQDRKLFTNNEQVRRRPRAKLMITSRQAHFNRPDVAQRLVIAHFKKPEYATEADLYCALNRNRPDVLGELMMLIAKTSDSMKQFKAPALPFRMSDFAALGWHVHNTGWGWLKPDDWAGLLGRLQRSQATFVTEDDALVAVIDRLLDMYASKIVPEIATAGVIGPISTGYLFTICKHYSNGQDWSFYNSPTAFGRKLRALRQSIETELGCRMTETTGRAREVKVTITRTDQTKSSILSELENRLANDAMEQAARERK